MLTSLFNGYKVHLIQSLDEMYKIRTLLDTKVTVGVDTETSGLNYLEDTIAGVCISCGHAYDPQHYHGFYIPVDHISYPNNLPKKEVIEFTQFIIDNYTTAWWNRDFDATMLEKEGIIFPCVGKTHDIQCMAHLIKGDSMPALKAFGQDYLKWDVLHYSDNNAEKGSFKTTDPTTSYIYAAGDPILTALLGRKIWADYPYIRKIYPLDNKFAECMRWFMQTTNLYLDHDKVQELLDVNAKELQQIKAEIYAFVGYQFRLDSNVEKAEALSRYVTLTAKTASGQFKVDKEVLASIDHPLAKMIHKYVTLNKFRSTYLKKMIDFPEGFRICYQHVNVSCLTEENIVRTESGYKSIADVVVGDKVLSENGFYAVTGTASFEDETIRVHLKNGATIQGNRKHPVLTSDGEWTKLGDLTLGQRVTMCRAFWNSDGSDVYLPQVNWGRARKVLNFSYKVDVELAQLLGCLDGDGSLVNDGVKLCFSAFEPEVEEFYTHLFSKRFNIEIPARQVGNDNTIQYKFCSAPLSRWLKGLGVKPHGTEKGLDISKWSTECQLAYVAAVFDTDGSLVPQKRNDRFNLCLNMTSKSVIDNVTMILRFHGIDVHSRISSKGRKQPLYGIRVKSFTKYGRFKEKIAKYMKCAHKLERLNAINLRDVRPRARWAGKEDTSEVVIIENTGIQKVYDITVGIDHTFIANGIVTHNTGRLSSGGSKGNPFFQGFNIQNVPKVEIYRYLHRDPDADLLYTLNDSPTEPIVGTVLTESGVCKVQELAVGDKVKTSKGEKEVLSITKEKHKMLHLVDGDKDLYVAPGAYVHILRNNEEMWVQAFQLKPEDRLI